MKKIYIALMVVIMGSIFSVEQEGEQLITPKNNKKKYVSKDQCVESKLDSPVLVNRFNRSINALRATVDAIQEEDFDILNDYADGEKDCFFKRADKVALTKYHEQQVQLNRELEFCNKKIQKMQRKLSSLHLEMKKLQKDIQ